MFDIEGSADALHWSLIGNVGASTNSVTSRNYQFTDYAPLSGTNYYRIRQSDIDGKFTYNQVRTLKIIGQQSVEILGNPVKNKQVSVRVTVS